MSMTPSGRGKCDRPGCGILQDNTGVVLFLIVSDIDEDGNMVIKHYCRINGCADVIREAGATTYEPESD